MSFSTPIRPWSFAFCSTILVLCLYLMSLLLLYRFQPLPRGTSTVNAREMAASSWPRENSPNQFQSLTLVRSGIYGFFRPKIPRAVDEASNQWDIGNLGLNWPFVVFLLSNHNYWLVNSAGPSWVYCFGMRRSFHHISWLSKFLMWTSPDISPTEIWYLTFPEPTHSISFWKSPPYILDSASNWGEVRWTPILFPLKYVFTYCSVMLLQVVMQLTEGKTGYSGKRWLTKISYHVTAP